LLLTKEVVQGFLELRVNLLCLQWRMKINLPCVRQSEFNALAHNPSGGACVLLRQALDLVAGRWAHVVAGFD
jgi:hypothetical protein